MNFREMQIRAWPGRPGRVQVMVHSSPVGDTPRPVEVRLPKQLLAVQEELADVFRGTTQGLWYAAPADALPRLARIGWRLAEVLLPPPVLSLLVGSLGAVGNDAGLRVRLCLDPELNDLPWELVYRPDVFGSPRAAGFLALDRRVSLVREAPRVGPPAERPGPDRLVFAGAFWADRPAPRDGYGVEAEYAKLTAALAPVDEYLTPSFVRADADVRAALQPGAGVFHYVGHVSEDGGHRLERLHDGSAADWLSAAEVADLLRQAGTRLAVFNACGSGRRGFVEPLLQTDLRATVGVFDVVSNRGAAAFTTALYSTLATGLTLDEAVSYGRARLQELRPADRVLAGMDCYEWAGYMVYLPTADPVLFPRRGDRAAEHQRREAAEHRAVAARVADPLPEPVRLVEALCGLLRGEFELVVTGTGVNPAVLSDASQQLRANDLVRKYSGPGDPARLWRLIDRVRRPDG